jgi:hypothetical protein
MGKKAKFNREWCNASLNPRFSPWLRPVEKNDNAAMCVVCNKTFSLSNMGRPAIESHANGPKHISNMQAVHHKNQPTILQSFVPVAANSNVPVVPVPVSTPVTDTGASTLPATQQSDQANPRQHGSAGIRKYLLNDQVSKAEILWCLKTVMSHSSYRSNSDLPELFRAMFPDSEIAAKFTLKKDKTSYLIAFGLAPFFHGELVSGLSSSETFVVCFDESLNKVIQKGQMDVHIKFWDKNKNTVSTRYLTSVFLGHANADALLNAFKGAIPPSRLRDVLQVSMDGPNVNHKLHSLLQNEIKSDAGSRQLLDIGSCGLHVVHGAFKTGHDKAKWEVHKFLYALHNLFKDSPARRADYSRLTESADFPYKFCSVRWVESL